MGSKSKKKNCRKKDSSSESSSESSCSSESSSESSSCSESSTESSSCSSSSTSSSSCSSSSSSSCSSSSSSSCSSTSSDSSCDCEATKRKKKKSRKCAPPVWKLGCIWLMLFAALWLLLFCLVVMRYAYQLPTALTISNETTNNDCFIAERAYLILIRFEAIGPNVVGCAANENATVLLIYNEIKKIYCAMNTALFKLELDVQEVSGAFTYCDMLNMYSGVQNIIVKLSPKVSSNNDSLLINTHFDSAPGSPGSGDPGVMVVVMLEVLRVLATGNCTILHPIVFLFNGAKENPYQGSHGFITSHKWAKDCKALINLDSAGSGHRDFVFQSSQNNPWLMQYYKQYAKHPYATILAEEFFKLNHTTSHTDFSIFHRFGPIPGLDISHTHNGYIHHTKFDKVKVISHATIQNTGDNVLCLAKAFANAPELGGSHHNTSGSTVFYDIFGKYLVLYTDTQGDQLNYAVSFLALLAILLSIFFISASSRSSLIVVFLKFLLTFIVHLIGIALGVGLVLLLAIYIDKYNGSMSWFTHRWMVICLYIDPLIFGLGIPTAFLVSYMKKDKLSLSFWVQLILNAQLLVVALLTVITTICGYKSAYLFMLATVFYAVASIINTITTLYRRGFLWALIVILFQIPAFLYFTYVGLIFFNALIPMTGRFGTEINPEKYIAGLALLIGFLSLGFIVPLINLFKNAKLWFFIKLIIGIIFAIIAFGNFVHPFCATTSVQRFNVLYSRRVFHEFNSSISKNESGYYFDLQDRRKFKTISGFLNLNSVIPMSSQCSQHMFCGLPVFNHNWNKRKHYAQWLPAKTGALPGVPKLYLLSKFTDTVLSTVRFNFRVDGPPHIGIFIGPLLGSVVIEWSFIDTMLREKWTPPYFIYSTKANNQTSLSFYIKFQKPRPVLTNATCEIGIGGHYVDVEYVRNPDITSFVQSFPDYTHVTNWPSSYERWIL